MAQELTPAQRAAFARYRARRRAGAARVRAEGQRLPAGLRARALRETVGRTGWLLLGAWIGRGYTDWGLLAAAVVCCALVCWLRLVGDP